MEGAAFWKRKDINAAQSSMKWWKKKFLAGDDAAIERFWAYQSHIIYWRGEIPGGFRVGRFIVRKQKRTRAPRPPRLPRPPAPPPPEAPRIWTPQTELDWS